MDIGNLFTRKMNGIPFSVLYDFENSRILLSCLGSEGKVDSILQGIPGLEFTKAEPPVLEANNLWAASAFPYRKISAIKTPYSSAKFQDDKKLLLEDLFTSLRGKKCSLLVSFSPEEHEEIENNRKEHERLLSRTHYQSSETYNLLPLMYHHTGRTRYKDTGDVQSSAEMLDMCNNCLPFRPILPTYFILELKVLVYKLPEITRL